LFEASTAKDTFISVHAAGPPPAESAYLVNKSGTVSVRVAPVRDTSKCSGAARYTGRGDPGIWCLDVGSVPLATEVTGQLTGEKTVLSLTVDARHGFMVLPFAVIVLALLLAIILAVVPGFLDNSIQRARLADAVRKSHELTGLDSWVRIRLQRGADVKVLITVVGGLTKNAPQQAKNARATLRDALDGFPTNRPLYSIAEAEAGKTDLPVTDFVDDDGKAVVHPATRLTDLVRLVKELSGQLDQLDSSIATLDGPYAVNPRREALAARRAVETVTTVAAAEAARHDVDVAWAVYTATAANPNSRGLGVTQAAAAAPVPVTTGFSPAPRLVEEQPSTSLLKAGLWTVSFAVVVGAVTVASAASATYIGKQTFGSGADYLALALAAFGSSAAGAVATVLAYWRIAGD
jgi:hypothetical protein